MRGYKCYSITSSKIIAKSNTIGVTIVYKVYYKGEIETNNKT
jgi:hypothetical protein